MATSDKEARRAARVRGAGATNVLASFGFSIPTHAPPRPQPPPQQTPQPTSKQQRSSLPPQSSARKTPVSQVLNGSARRPRSVSVSNSSVTKAQPLSTPQNNLGKRKRGSKEAQSSPHDNEPDELSPESSLGNAPVTVASVEKARRAPVISPLSQDDGEQDELSMVEGSAVNVSSQKPAPLRVTQLADTTPVPVRAKPRTSRASTGPSPPERTPIAQALNRSIITTQHLSPKSSAKAPITPTARVRGRPRKSTPSSATARLADLDDAQSEHGEADSEDELSPQQEQQAASVVKPGSARPIPRTQPDEAEDELASPTQGQEDSTVLSQAAHQTPQHSPPPSVKSTNISSTTVETGPSRGPAVTRARGRPKKGPTPETAPQTLVQQRKRRQIIVHDDEDIQVRSRRATRNRQPSEEEELEEHDPDELSPDANRTRVSIEDASQILSDNEYEGSGQEKEPEEVVRPAPKTKQDGQPPRKRARREGPLLELSKLRMKSGKNKNLPSWHLPLTAVDVVRSVITERLEKEANRIRGTLANIKDRNQQRKIKLSANNVNRLQDAAEDRFFDLVDANNTYNVLKKKLREKTNAKRQTLAELVNVRNQKAELDVQMDELREEHRLETKAYEARDMLNTNIFEIEAAIKNGRERARAEGRENEGPDVPLSMLLENSAVDVGSCGGNGLLADARRFNGFLERTIATL